MRMRQIFADWPETGAAVASFQKDLEKEDENQASLSKAAGQSLRGTYKNRPGKAGPSKK